MARHTGPKSRLSRRVRARLFPKDDKILTKRNYPPGMHGQKRSRSSEYGVQLLEKQKAKWQYGLMEKQFRKYYEQAAKRKGQTGAQLIQYLEARLDNVVFRLGFAQTRPQARQIVSHGFIQVNGKKVSIPSYQVKAGDAVAVREGKKATKYMQIQKAIVAKHKAPDWLQLDGKNLSGKVVSLPTPESIDSEINTQLIVELYSR